jgi:hypothetical protein
VYMREVFVRGENVGFLWFTFPIESKILVKLQINHKV